MPPTNDHELQVDLFEYKYKQPKRLGVKKTEINGKVYKFSRIQLRRVTPVDPYGIIAVNTFTKKVHVESMKLKVGGADWRPAVENHSNIWEA